MNTSAKRGPIGAGTMHRHADPLPGRAGIALANYGEYHSCDDVRTPGGDSSRTAPRQVVTRCYD